MGKIAALFEEVHSACFLQLVVQQVQNSNWTASLLCAYDDQSAEIWHLWCVILVFIEIIHVRFTLQQQKNIFHQHLGGIGFTCCAWACVTHTSVLQTSHAAT